MYDTTPVEILDFHHAMLVDKVRLDSFMHAILETVKPGDIVLDLGSGTGVLACLACMVGAKHVYAIEKRGIIQVAREIIEANDLGQRVTFINDWSTAITLPEKADVLITETIGNLGFEEGILRWVLDARKRLLKTDARIIPQDVALILAPVEAEKAYWPVETWMVEDVFTYDFSALHKLAANNLLWTDLGPEMALAEPQVIGPVNMLKATEADIRGEVTYNIGRDGLLHGLGGWFTSNLSPSVTLTNAPPNKALSWSNMLLPLERPLPLMAGDELHVQLHTSDQSKHWHWQVTHYPQTAEGEEAHCIILPPGSTQIGQLPAKKTIS